MKTREQWAGILWLLIREYYQPMRDAIQKELPATWQTIEANTTILQELEKTFLDQAQAQLNKEAALVMQEFLTTLQGTAEKTDPSASSDASSETDDNTRPSPKQ